MNVLYKISLIVVIGVVGVGLIFNGVNSVNANNELPALVEIPESISIDYSPVEENSSSESYVITEQDIDKIENVLANMHEGQWFSWSDPDNKTYAGLIVRNGYNKPSKELLLLSAQVKVDTDNNKRAIRNALLVNKQTLEAKFLSDNFTNADVVQYLRILGGF
jgi:hypothetical protein